MNRPSPGPSRERLVVWAGGSLIASMLLLGRLVPALHRVDDGARASWAESVSARQRYELATAELSRGESTSELDARMMRLESAVITASSEADAVSALVQHVGAIADLCDVSIASATPTDFDADESHVRRVAIRFSLSGTTRATFELLRELEIGTPLAVIRQLRIVNEGAGRGGAITDHLTIEMVVESPLAIRTSGRGS